MFFLCAASLLNFSTIAFDRLLAVSLHLRYQELVTSKRVTIVLISIWLTSFITALIYIFLPKSNEMVAAVILLVGYFLTTVAYVRIYKVVKYHQNQIYSQNQLQNAQTREALRQRKSAYNALFVYFVFLVCYLPFLPSVILYLTNTSEISFLIAKHASFFFNLPEFIIKYYCLLLAVSRDSPNCKKHNQENTSFGREYDVRMRRSTRRNLQRTSNCRRKLGRVNFRKDFWDCY